jgi:integrase
VVSISRRIGHGSPTMTLKVYAHLFRPDDRATAVMDLVLKQC